MKNNNTDGILTSPDQQITSNDCRNLMRVPSRNPVPNHSSSAWSSNRMGHTISCWTMMIQRPAGESTIIARAWASLCGSIWPFATASLHWFSIMGTVTRS